MRRIMDMRNASELILRHYRGFQHRPLCDSTFSAKKGRKVGCSSNNSLENAKFGSGGGGDIRELDVYHDLEKLDFMKAAKILFTHPPKMKKFGIDFHLVQLFFACMPSLAVYLVAQYARHEMRKMDAELELKKKAEEEAKAKEEMEAAAAKEKEGESETELLEIKERLHALENTVNEIAAETRKTKPTGDVTGKTSPSNVATKDQPSAVSDPNQISDDKAKLQNRKSSDVK